MNSSKKEPCPVCGMKTNAGLLTVEYHKMSFHFCSTQCQQTFQAHPALYSTLRVKIQSEVLKTRKLRLVQPLGSATAHKVVAQLQKLMGVKVVQIEGRRLTIRYDLLQLTLAQIESTLSHSQALLDNRWLARIWRNWVRDTEVIELDNLAAKPGACCNRPPPRA